MILNHASGVNLGSKGAKVDRKQRTTPPDYVVKMDVNLTMKKLGKLMDHTLNGWRIKRPKELDRAPRAEIAFSSGGSQQVRWQLYTLRQVCRIGIFSKGWTNLRTIKKTQNYPDMQVKIKILIFRPDWNIGGIFWPAVVGN